MVQLFYAAAIAFALGLSWRTLVAVPTSVSGLLLLIAIAQLLVLWRLRSGARQYVVAVFLLGVVFGVWRTEGALTGAGTSVLESLVGDTVVLEGVVVREPEQRERSLHLYVETDDDDLVLVTADRYETVAYGDRLTVSGTLTRPESFTTDLGRTFNYPGYLLARGVEYRMSYPELTVVGHNEGNPVLATLYTLKQRFVSALGTVIADPAYGLGVGLLLGIKQALGTELTRAFQVTGLTHIVVLSGYNLSLVVAFVGLALSFFLCPRARLLIGLLAIVSFAFIVGLSATVMRASLMAALALIATTYGRQYLVLRALVVSGVLMLLWNPLLLVYDIGFQFSFMATLGLVLVAPQLETALVQGKIFTKARDFLVATVAAQVAVLPLIVYHIGEASLVSLPANMLVLPVVPVAMGLTFTTGLLALAVPALGAVAAYPTTLVLTAITATASGFATIPFATVPIPPFSFWWVVVAYAVLAALWYYWLKRWPATAVSSLPVLPSTTASALVDWTIEDEIVVKKRVLANEKANPATHVTPLATKSLSKTSSNDLPIFFR